MSVTSTKNVGSSFKICLNTKCRLPKQQANDNEIEGVINRKLPFVVKDFNDERINSLYKNDDIQK